MEQIDVDGLELSYVDVGEGPETVVLSHSYLVDHRQFASQIVCLAESYRVIAYDHRDHGESGRAQRPYGMDRLVRDGEHIIEGLDATPCHWMGPSTGGFVGMRLAIQRPVLLNSLVLMDTAGGREATLTTIKNRHDPARAVEKDLWRSRIAANEPRAHPFRSGDLRAR